LTSSFDVKAINMGKQGAHGWHVDAGRVGGTRQSGSWRSRDAVLGVGFGAQSERLPGTCVVEFGWVGLLTRWPRARLQWLRPVQFRLGCTVHQGRLGSVIQINF
jgi:hypothetical protein